MSGEKHRDAEMLEEMRWAVAHIENELLGLDREGFEKYESKQASVAFFIISSGRRPPNSFVL